MTKKLIALLLVLVMLVSLCMTACSSDENETGEEAEVEDEAQRNNLILTLYAITDASTTPEALAEVEEKISNYCVAKYKTAIDLRFFTEDEYQAGLNKVYDLFAAEEAEALQAEKEAQEAARSEAAYKASLSQEERQRYEQKQRIAAKEAEKAAQEKAAEEAELIAEGKDQAVVKDAQMDIIYINGRADYESYINQELLVDLTPYLNADSKVIRDYVFPSFMTGAAKGAAIYGIPNNCAVPGDETYFIVNRALAQKYGVDFTKVRSITDLEETLAAVKAGDPGVVPLAGDFEPEGVSFYPDEDMAHIAAAFTDTLPGGLFNIEKTYHTFNPNSSAGTAFVDYCATKASWRQKGYLADSAANFFISVQKLTEEEKTAWENRGYDLVLYKGADFTTDAALQGGLFGISKYCQAPERAMEIIRLMSIDSTMRNLLAFGLEDEHYVRSNENPNVITKVDSSYSMDFFKTGNTLIGYVPSDMDPDYVAKAKAKNLNSTMNAFLGFTYDFDTEANEPWLALMKEWKTYIDPIYAQLSYGAPNYMDLLAQVYNETYNNPNARFSSSYPDWQAQCTFRDSYTAYAPTLKTLSEKLHFTED